jgi:type I restriction enzyme, S subunit
MSKTLKLWQVANYSKERINVGDILLENFVTVDNLLPNKKGLTIALNKPPRGGTLLKFKMGNILVGNIRPYLKKIWFANRDGAAAADVLVFDVKTEHCSKYVYYAMFRDDFFNHMMRGKKGTKMPRGDKNQIMDFLIPNVKYTTQQQFAAVLSALDIKIEHNNRINTELETMAKTLYGYWFVQFDFPNKYGKPFKSSGGKMVWNEELKREIPEGWHVGSLLDIAEYTNGIPCQKYRPIGSDCLRVIKIKEMHDGFTSATELVHPSIPENAIIENGDILFAWSASLEVLIWSGGKGALNQHIFKVTSSKYPKSFYYFQLLNYLQHFKMMAENRKTTMGHITQDHLSQSRVVLPPRGMADKLENIIRPIFAMHNRNRIENRKFSELRDWLLPMLMNGQVTVK